LNKIDPRPRPPLLVVTGMAREAAIASGPGTVVVASGGSTSQLRELLASYNRPRWRGVLSFGLAGGLQPGLAAGDTVVATGIVSDERRWSGDLELPDWISERLARGGLKAQRAEIAGANAPVLAVAAKAELFGRSGAAAVDMESHVAAEYAAEHGLPYASLRVVCDPHSRSLPPLAATALRQDGRVSVPAVLASLMRSPAQLVQLPGLSRDAAVAFRSLRRCRDLLGIGGGLPDLFELFGDVA
jgi:hopanoid-associated phosphorylase